MCHFLIIFLEIFYMTTIGYIRVSSNKQTFEHQRFEIENFAKREGIQIDTWIEETISSQKALEKRKLGELLNNLQENDILITCEISRLGRSLLEVMKILDVWDNPRDTDCNAIYQNNINKTIQLE